MSYILLILASGVLYYFAWRQYKKNKLDIKQKNSAVLKKIELKNKKIKENPNITHKKYKSGGLEQKWNWFYGMIWPGYLFTLATGLWFNNLILPYI